MPLKIGTKAPDFTLKTKSGHGLEDVTLSKNFGKKNSVLLFFPLAFTGVCTKEMCEFRDALSDFQSLNAQVFAISVDSRFALNAFAEKENLTFPLLSDFNKEVSKAYGAQYDNFLGMVGVAKRAAFVIDKSGQIRYRWVSEDAKVKPDQAAIKAVLKEL